MPRISELLTVLLGVIGTIMLFIGALSINSGDIRGLGTAILMLFQFFVAMIALPFLIVSIYRTEEIPRWFRNTIMTISILNAILMLISSNAASGDKTVFFVSAILELLPLLFLYQRRDYVTPKFIIHTT